jgi:hypothetical protein
VFTPEQHRAEVANYTESAKQGNAPNEMHKFLRHEQSLTMLADNEQWLADNHDNLANNLDKLVPVPEPRVASEATLAADEEHILRCLGAALIMRWNTLQTELQRELFDNAGSMGALLDTATLRAQIARFLRKHTNGHDEMGSSSVQSLTTPSPTLRPTSPQPEDETNSSEVSRLTR